MPGTSISAAWSPGARAGGAAGPFRDFNEVTKGAEKIDGLFTLHKKDEHLYAEIKPQPVRPAAPGADRRSPGAWRMAGHARSNFDDEWVLVFRRVGDQVQLVRRNIHYKAPAGHAARQGGQAELHRLDPDGPADPRASTRAAAARRDRLRRHLPDRLRPARPRRRSTAAGRSWHKVKGFPNNVELEVEATFGGGGCGAVLRRRRRRRRRPPGHHAGHPLQPVKAPDSRLPAPARRRPRRPLPQRRPRISASPTRHQLRPDDQPLAAREGRPRGQALAAEEADRLVRRGHRARSSTGPTSRRASSSGTRRSRRSASATRSPSAGRRPGATTSTPRTSTTAPSAGSPPTSTFAMSCLRANPMTGEMIDGDVIFDAAGSATGSRSTPS